MVDEQAREAPADHARGSEAQRERHVGRRGRHVAEERRPGLADADRRVALGHVHVGEAQARVRLLVGEGAAGETAEEVHLHQAAELGAVGHLGPLPVQGQAGVADVAAVGPLVRGVFARREFRGLAVAERKIGVLRVQRRDHEALDRQRALVGRADRRSRRRRWQRLCLFDRLGCRGHLGGGLRLVGGELLHQLLEFGHAGLQRLLSIRLGQRNARHRQCSGNGDGRCSSLDPEIHGQTSPCGLWAENAPPRARASIGGWSKKRVALTQQPPRAGRRSEVVTAYDQRPIHAEAGA